MISVIIKKKISKKPNLIVIKKYEQNFMDSIIEFFEF